MSLRAGGEILIFELRVWESASCHSSEEEVLCVRAALSREMNISLFFCPSKSEGRLERNV